MQHLLNFFYRIDLALTQASAQHLDGNVDIHDLVRALKEPIGDGLAHLHAGDARDRIIQRLHVLDVDGSDYGNAGVENFKHVFVALLVFRTRNVCMREFIDYDYFRVPGQDCLDVKFFEACAAVLNALEGYLLKSVDQGFGLKSSVSLDQSQRDVHALAPELVS